MEDKRKTPFSLRTSDDVMEWLKAKADKNERSLNYVITKLLETAKRREEEGMV